MLTDFSQIAPILTAALVVFAIYRRFRRNFGRQVLRPTRMMLRVALLAIVGCLLVPVALRSAEFLSAVIVGLVLGVGLGMFAASRTRFVRFDDRLHYVPHTATGVAVSLLFLGRLVYRMAHLVSVSHAAHADAGYPLDSGSLVSSDSMVSSPLTVGLLFVLLGYYVYYYSRVLWKSKHLEAEDIETVSAATS